MEPLGLIVIVALGVGGIIWIERARRQRALRRAEALAAKHGFLIDTDSKKPPPQPFDLFEIGHSRNVWIQLWRAGSGDSVFNYEYTTGSGKHSTTHRLSCALIELPFRAPHTQIGPEGLLSRIGRSIGFRDIEVESPEFNRAYRIRSDDERFAITLLDHEMIAWLLRPESGRGNLRFELTGKYLLCISDRLPVEELFGFHDWAQRVPSHMPDVMTSLYPLPEMPA